MARRYARDNRGRFAPKGSGATARGGRLKTASGKKRATVTAKGIGKAPAGTVGRSGKVKARKGGGKVNQFSGAPKVTLSRAELRDRMFGERSQMVKGRRPLPAGTDTSARAKRTRQARAAQEAFEGFLSASARERAMSRQGRGTGKLRKEEIDRAFVEAFASRPRYSTKQKVRPNWSARQGRKVSGAVFGS